MISFELEAIQQTELRHFTFDLNNTVLLQTQVTQLVLSSASAANDAASLVFAQSIVDAAAWSYLKVGAMVDPATWEGQIDDRKVGVKDLKAKSYEDIRVVSRAGRDGLGDSRLRTLR